MRRPWAAALALSMALGLAACGGGEGADAPTPPVEVTAEATRKPTVTPTATPTAAPTLEPTPGPTAEANAQPSAQPVELREYTLTEIALPEGWSPTADSNNVAAGWAVIERTESGRVVEAAIYRAADGAILDLDGCWVYGGEGPMSRGDTTRCLVVKSDLWNVFDVERGKLLLEASVPDGAEDFWARLDPCFPAGTWPQPTQDEATGLYGYRDEAGNWTVPARYLDLFYLGDGMFNYWGGDDMTDCGLVSIDGVETPTETFKYYFNGGLTANYGLISIYFGGEGNYHHAYFDYAGNQASEPFTWAGPIGDDGAGFVCKDGKLCRIQF